jgi:hypothetical protein
MDVNDYLRGGLSGLAASLVYDLPNEILKWQYPVNAAAEKMVQLQVWLISMLRFSRLEATRR